MFDANAHTVGGWHFRRGDDGSVTVYAEITRETTLTADEWAAVVAAMSRQGAIPATVTAATSLHLAGAYRYDDLTAPTVPIADNDQ